jgi:hypothetical protein
MKEPDQLKCLGPFFAWHFGDGKFLFPVFSYEDFEFFGDVKVCEGAWKLHCFV